MAYTYIITYLPNNTKYYGVQYHKNANPEDLGISYFSSSKTVKALIKECGIEYFQFEIRKIFESKDEAIRWERRFLTKINAAKSPLWFNLSNGGAINPGGYKLSQVTRSKMSKPKSKDHKRKLKEHLDINRKLPDWSDERKQNQSKRMLGNKINVGKTHDWSDERKQNQSKRMHGNTYGKGKHTLKEVICPNCGKHGSGPNMSRYHFDKCSNIN